MLLGSLVERNRLGESVGLPSFCSSNAFVIDAILTFAGKRDLPVLIEATCNQVNQFGGYTGLKPADFAEKLRSEAAGKGISSENLILGGDHLGPNPWRHLPVDEAMRNAKDLVRGFVEAGFTKIHLDASMACGGEPTPSFEEVAARSANLCSVAEQFAPKAAAISYVIGTEVPVPGGETDDMSGIQITTPDRLKKTVETHQEAFSRRSLDDGFGRVMAVVVQPGVDFSHSSVIEYDPSKVRGLTRAISQYEGYAFEVHSTDYQATESLKSLVRDRSAILKVGPELTFRFREAVVALTHIEDALSPDKPARTVDCVLHAMEEDPKDWESYYVGSDETVAYLKLFSLSDRIRYYWDKPEVISCIDRLMSNLNVSGIPAALAAQYFNKPPGSPLPRVPLQLIADRIGDTIRRYYRATGWDA